LETEQRSEVLFLQAPQAMLLVDDKGAILNANRAAQSLFGYSESEFRQLTLLHVIPAALGIHDDGSLGQLEQALRNPEFAHAAQFRFKKRNHIEFAAELGVVPLQVGDDVRKVLGITDVSSKVAAQQAVSRSLREKETLLKEIHHRVKNNLQIISSLLVLQSDQMPTPRAKELLEESVHRIRSMALIHEQLYGVESLERIDLGDYARLLTESLRGAFAPHARVRVEADEVEVNVELAVPLGLILNELITNAFKYGLVRGAAREAPSGGRTGSECDVIVEVGIEGDLIRLAVTDSGPGVPPDFNPDRSSTLGLQLIRSLNRQLRGNLAVDSDRGARFVVTCTHPAMAVTQRLSVKNLAARAKAQQNLR
ncbi:MAG: sensor histidine kinase, partial [Myxococcota bacterium]